METIVQRKKVSVLVPCFNEIENIRDFAEALLQLFTEQLRQYEYEIVFIDNCSTDGTREALEELCQNNSRLKAIFNARNFGWSNSTFHGLQQMTGDCAILMCADFQDPIELLPTFLSEWEKGYQIVAGIKNQSEEVFILWLLRSLYYKLIRKLSSVDQVEHFFGFGLYDKSFLSVLRQLDDSAPFLRGIVAELGSRRKDVYYVQPRRRAGKSHFNFYHLYDFAMQGFTSYTKAGLRLATFAGFLFSAVTMLIALFYFVSKIFWWDAFQVGIAPIVIGMFFLGSIQLFFLGLLGEYVLSINVRVMKRPLVVEEKRINF